MQENIADNFFHSQDMDSFVCYQENNVNKSQNMSQKSGHNTLKRQYVDIFNSSSPSSSSSYVIKKVRKGKRILKINIENVEESQSDEIVVQYIVNEYFDEILEETELLIQKICKRISGNVL